MPSLVFSCYDIYVHIFSCCNMLFMYICAYIRVYICACMYTYIYNTYIHVCVCVRCVCVRVYIQQLISWCWQRCIGCLKMQVSFGKRATNHRALLRKITYKDTASYDSTPPCNCTPPLSYILWAHKSKFIFKLKYSHVVNIVCYFWGNSL